MSCFSLMIDYLTLAMAANTNTIAHLEASALLDWLSLFAISRHLWHDISDHRSKVHLLDECSALGISSSCC